MMAQLFQSFQPTLTESGLRSFGLSLQTTAPCKFLEGMVHSYLQISATRATPYPVIPDGSQAVFMSASGSIIGGAQKQACAVQIIEPGEYFGIRFYPGALRYFFQLNVAEITGQFADSHYFPSVEFGELHHRVYESQNFQDRANICEQWLLRNFVRQPDTSFDQALAMVYKTFGNISVAQLSSMVGWSSRHLNRLFHQNTGLSTKTFAQVIRMQHVCKKLYMMPENSLNTALEAGFFDQSHFAKDFKKQFMVSPRLFFNQFKSDFYNR